jgi:hypothetical protein
MAEEPRRRRMSRSISLVLLTSLPGLAGCGQRGEPTEEVEEVTEEPPPSGPEQVIGAPFVAWWGATHPPIVVRKTVPRSVAASGGYSRGGSRVYYRPYYGGSYYGGRSGYLGGGRPAGPSHSAPVTRGGFGSTGHAAAGA